ncbi:MAG: SulP family inorganic anion transporter [Opitutae bacterium]|nr:SulP family inorganic anion transporter [Opitutae bacterium]
MHKGEEAAGAVDQIQRASTRWMRARFPLAAEIRGYNWTTLRADLIAGATVSLVSIPQAIGFALIAGLPPLMVIMCVIVGGFVCALFTSSRHLVFGPTNSISIILAATIYSFHGVGLVPTEIALLLALLIGVFQLVAGLAQLGKLTQFISRSVIIAYSTAIGLLLAAGQISHLLGLPAGERGGFIPDLANAVVHLVQLDFNGYAAMMGVATLLLFWLIERFFPKLPPELLGLVVLSLLTQHLGLTDLGIRTIKDEGALAVSIPSFIGMPLSQSNLAMVPSLLSAALAISILGMLEAISIAKTLAAKSGQRLDPNQELIAMGSANIAASLYNAMPGSASFARSGANFQSGARTQLSALMSSLIVLGALFFVTPLINFIPVPSLAAHLIRIGLKMINWEQIRIAYRATGSDKLVFCATLLAAFLLKLDTAIYVGVGVSLALFLRKASAPSLVEYSFDATGHLAQIEEKEERKNPAISIVHVEGELFFGAADLFQEQVRYLADEGDLKVIILRMKNARHLDATSVMSLMQLHDYLQSSGRHLLISGINPDVEQVLRDSGAWVKIGADNIFPAEANLTMSTKRALLRASHLLQIGKGQKADVRIFYDRKREKATEPSGTTEDKNEAAQVRDFQI